MTDEKWGSSSKITDMKGNLKIAFHGTFSDFNQFDINKSCAGTLGLGFYFTSQESDALENYSNEAKIRELLGEDYSLPGPGRVMSVYLDIKNPLIVGGKETTRFSAHDGSLHKFLKAFQTAHLRYPMVPAGGVKYMIENRFIAEAKASKDNSLTTEDIVGLVYSQLGLNEELYTNGHAKKQMLQDAFSLLGFDGVVFNDVVKRYSKKMTGISRGAQHFVAFNPEQIQIVGSVINDCSVKRKTTAESIETAISIEI